MDINKINVVENEVVVEPQFEWPQAYYLPTDGELRKKALDRAIAEGLEPDQNKIRREIWERRYNSPAGVDRFLGGYMNLSYYANVVKSNFMARFHKKDIKETQAFLCYDIPDKYGEAGSDILYLELYHLIDYYIDVCLKDRKYSGLLMGLGSMKKESLIDKIATDIYRACYCVPLKFGLLPAHELLQKAAKQCFYNRFPAQRALLENKLADNV